MRFILGSASPRRRELLSQLGVNPDEILPAEIDETPQKAELPRDYCARMAREKSAALIKLRGEIQPDEIFLTSDTTVALGRRILGKPDNQAEAEQFLRLLSGRRHRVITSIALAKQGEKLRERLVVSSVKFKRLSEEEISWYLKGGDWQGKAGGYAIQGPAALFVLWIEGSYSSIVGLPLYETGQLLRSAGLPLSCFQRSS